MPPESIPWDRKKYFKARKEGRSESVGSEDSRELTRCGLSQLLEEYGVLLKGVSLDHDRSQPAERILADASVSQCKNKLCCSSVCDKSCNRNSQVFGSRKDLTLDCSANTFIEKSCSSSHSDPVWLSHHDSTSVSVGRGFEGDMDQHLADGLQNSSNQGHTDYSVGLARNSIRWTPSGSLSSHESGLSYSISSKSMSVDFANSKVEFRKQNMNLCQSASGDIISCVTPTTPSEETSPWKRPRLKWGEGLAKFEKKSLVPDDGHNKGETISCTSSQLSDCASPATPSSVVCNLVPGSEDKPFTKAVAVSKGNGSSHSLVSDSQKHLESIFPFNLEKVDLSSIIHVVPSLMEMMDSDKRCLKNSDSTSSSAMNKLLLLKSEILKAVDMTESQVDLLENELKSINNESGHNNCRFLASDPPAIEFNKASGQVQQGASEMSCRPALPLHESADMVVVNVPNDSGNYEVLKADMDNSGTATSKLVERPFTKSHAVSYMINDVDSFFDFDASCSPQEVQKSSKITSHAGKLSNACISGTVVGSNNSLVMSDSGWHMDVDERVINSIWASNTEYANKASKDLNIVYPLAKTIECNSSDGCSEDLFIRELIVRKKKALRFKEQAVALKWRRTDRFWKNDIRLFSVRNHCSKAQKKWELFSLTKLINRPSVRSKSLHLKKSSLDMGKHLSTSHLKPCKSFLKMPSLILDDAEKRFCIFLSSNGRVEDPYAAEKERSMINAWTSEEREIFMDKLVSHGKDFRKIASFLDHKTVADCVQFYYKNHKSESFTKTIKQQDKRMQVKSLSNYTYLVTPSKKWDRTTDTASLDILGAASELVARNSERKENKKRSSCGLRLNGVRHTRPPRKDVLFPDKPSDFRFAEDEIRTSDNEILPGACGSVSSEAISSCITSSVNQGEGHCNGTLKTFSVISKPLSIPEDVLFDDEETCSDESSCELDVGYWTDVEKSVFVRAVQSYGKDFCMVSRCIRTKSMDQCKSFYSKARKCLGLDIMHPDNDHEQQSVLNGSNGDKSAPVLTPTQEAVSGIGGHKVSQKIDADVSLSVSVMSNVDSMSPDAGVTFHACQDKLKDKEWNFEKPYADLKVEGQLVNKSASNLRPVCVGNKPTVSNDTDKQAFPTKYYELANKSVAVSPSLSFTVPYIGSLAQLGTERGLMDPPLLHYHAGEHGTSSDNIQNKVSCIIENRGMPAPCRGSPDNQPLVGFTADVPSQMYVSEGSVRDATSQNCMADRTSCGLLNPPQRYSAGSPTPEISFAQNSFGESQRHFQRSHFAVNHVVHQACAPSDQLYVSQTFKKEVENKGSAWNLSFEDSTISRGSLSDSENGLPSYATIPRRGYVQKCNNLNSNFLVTELSDIKQKSHHSRNQTINSVGPEKQGKQANFKLFGQVLTSSTAPETHSLEENKLTLFAQMYGSPVDKSPFNHHSIYLGSESLPVRSFRHGRLMQTVPLLAGCPIQLPHSMLSSSVLNRQPLLTTAVPNANAPTVGSVFDNSLNRSMIPLSHTQLPTTRSDL